MTSAERLAAAVEAAQAGESVEEAARRYEVPAAHVERMLRAMDVGFGDHECRVVTLTCKVPSQIVCTKA